ncbi:MAG: YicC family protein [Clostridiales bacterium]|nr:YicC family protein [Clostridiales bacterium]
MKSMTGYGKGEASNCGRTVTIELKAVNHRYLDMNIKMPKLFLFLEEVIRKNISQVISRGHLDVYVSYENRSEEGQGSFTSNVQLAKDYYYTAELLARELNIENDVTLSQIVKVPDIIVATPPEEDEDKLKTLVILALCSALASLEEMRIAEGEHIKADIAEKLTALKSLTAQIEERAPLVKEEYAVKLKERIAAMTQGLDIDETRIMTEIALFADRSSIDEELTRLKSHFNQLESLINDENPIGRKLDFLVQELNREVNTIGSKANDLTITNNVLMLKNEIEKIREQAQNVE